MPPTRMALAAQGSSAGFASSGCEDGVADRKAPDAHTGSPEQHQAYNDPGHSVSAGSSSLQCTLKILAVVVRDDQPHSQAHSSGAAKGSHSPEHHEDTLPTSHLMSHKQDADRPADQSRHGMPADAQQHGGLQSSAAEQMESRYVHGVYDIIAGHFSATRFAIWPKVNCSHRGSITSLRGRVPALYGMLVRR